MPTRHSGPESERLALDVFIKLNRAHASVNRRVHASLREYGITAIQFGVLEVIHHSGPLPLTTIADKNLCSQNSMCSVIDTMERHNLVKRDRSEQDRRIVHVSLTEKGHTLFQEIWPAHVERISETASALNSEELKTLDALLRKLGKSAYSA